MLTHDTDAWVALHLLICGFPERLPHHQLLLLAAGCFDQRPPAAQACQQRNAAALLQNPAALTLSSLGWAALSWTIGLVAAV